MNDHHVLSARAVFLFVAVLYARGPVVGDEPATSEKTARRTRISIRDGQWQLNGKPVFEDSDSEGLLVNVRMVHAVFEDRNPKTRPKGFDPDANTGRFIAKIPEYLKFGVIAFTIHLQGGDPGYSGAICSAFEADGSLRAEYMARVARVVEACDRTGAVVILGLFNRHRDQLLKNFAAVEKGVQDALGWIVDKGYTNIIVEIAEKYSGEGYDHPEFNDAVKMAALVKLAKKTAPKVLVSSCRQGTGRIDADVGNASDFLATHLTGLPSDSFMIRVTRVMTFGKPIVCTADDKVGKDGAAAADAASRASCSWGFASPKNEKYPFRFEGAADDPEVYRMLKSLAEKTE